MVKNLPPSANFGRQQRNVPTEPDKTAYDPDFGKPRPNPNKTVYDPNFGKSKPTDIRPPGSEPTKIRPSPESPESPLQKATHQPDLLEEQMSSGETTKIAPKGPPEPMQAADLQKELTKAKRGKPGKPGETPDLRKLPPGKTLPQGAPGLAEYEKSSKAAKIKPKPSKGIGAGTKTRSILKTVGKIVSIGAVAGVIGFAILDHLGVAIFEHAADVALEKMGPKADLSGYLPNGTKAKKVVWSAASYRRYSPHVGDSPLETWLAEEITLHPPQNGILAFGISIGDWPTDIVVSDINVNELGDGQSDWLCEGYQGYLICRSLGSYPLNSELKTVVTLHLASWPAYEVDKMLAAGDGSRAVYFIVK